MAIDPADIHLDEQQQKTLADLAERTGTPWSKLLQDALRTLPTPAAPKMGNGRRTLYDAFSDAGLIGCIQGPRDLSSNPEHMERFGRDSGENPD